MSLWNTGAEICDWHLTCQTKLHSGTELFISFFKKYFPRKHLHLLLFFITPLTRFHSSCCLLSRLWGKYHLRSYLSNVEKMLTTLTKSLNIFCPSVNIRLCVRAKSWRQPSQSRRVNMQTLINLYLFFLFFLPPPGKHSLCRHIAYSFIHIILCALFNLFLYFKNCCSTSLWERKKESLQNEKRGE